VPYASEGQTYDVDYSSAAETNTAQSPSYAAVTARSYHSGLVNGLLMDGSVRSIRDGISLEVWRGLCTRAGGEVPGDF